MIITCISLHTCIPFVIAGTDPGPFRSFRCSTSQKEDHGRGEKNLSCGGRETDWQANRQAGRSKLEAVVGREADSGGLRQVRWLGLALREGWVDMFSESRIDPTSNRTSNSIQTHL